MQGQATAFETYALGLLAVLERLPVPFALALDRDCKRVESNSAYRELIGTKCTFASDDGEIVAAELPIARAARNGIEVADVGMRARRSDGKNLELIASAWPLRDEQGAVQGSVTVFVDITQSTEAQTRRRYRLITEAMAEFVWLDAPDGSAMYSNSRWLEYTGLTPEQNAGFGWESVVHPDDLKRLEAERERTLQTGEAFENECRYRGKDGKYRWFLFRCIPMRDEQGNITSWLGTATDIDKQKRAEAQQTFFALASDVLGSTLDVATTLQRIARLAVASLGTWCQIDLPDAHGRLRVAVVAHEDPQKEKDLGKLVDQHIYDEQAPMGPPAVVRTLKPQLLHRVDENAVQRVIPEPRHRAVYKHVGYASGIMVPLRIRDRVLGSLGIASDDPTRLYTDFDIVTALELGRRGAIALENAQTFQREHRVASTLQRALLPTSLPHNGEVAFASAYSSAASAQGEAVGGDWYDAFPLDGGRVAVSVGDVAGHGVEAAVTMGVVRQAIRAAALEHHAPREVLARANRVVMLEQRHSMITAFFGIYNTHSRDFTYTIAGHPRPIMVDANGELTAFECSGPPLGEAFDEILLDQRAIGVPAESAVVFFTDGLIEYSRDVLHAEKRLESAMRERTFLKSDNPAQAIIDAVLEGAQGDDIAVLVMRAS